MEQHLQSRDTLEGPSRAPHRAMYKAMGLDDEDLERPLVGVSTTSNESTPCNMHLGRLAQYTKEGVKEVKCTPREFTAISVSDVISMGHHCPHCIGLDRPTGKKITYQSCIWFISERMFVKPIPYIRE